MKIKHIRKKLNNNDGVTILIALVGFMFAAMIAIVIISAAVTSAQRVMNDRKINQAHLTLESAAQIIRDEMEGMTYTYTKDEANRITFNVKPAGASLASEIEAAISYIEANAGKEYSSSDSSNRGTYNNNPVTADFKISVKDGEGDEVDTIETVNVTFIMKNKESSVSTGDDPKNDGPKYDLYFTLSIDGEDQMLYLSMDGRRKLINTTSGNKEYEITWKQVSINEIGD